MKQIEIDPSFWIKRTTEIDRDTHYFLPYADPINGTHVFRALQIVEDYPREVLFVRGNHRRKTPPNEQEQRYRDAVEMRHESAVRFVLRSAHIHRVNVSAISIVDQWIRLIVHELETAKIPLPFSAGGLSIFARQWFEERPKCSRYVKATTPIMSDLVRGLAALKELEADAKCKIDAMENKETGLRLERDARKAIVEELVKELGRKVSAKTVIKKLRERDQGMRDQDVRAVLRELKEEGLYDGP